MSRWTEADIPPQAGRTVLVTGANSGLGLQTAMVLAGRGATVLLACRDPHRGQAALARVRSAARADATLVQLDLADLGSVRKAADEVRAITGDRLDVLVNNAGVMATPPRRTVDGFELQMGTNHLGHAALTWLLAPALVPGARVVTVSSLAHRGGGLDVEDLNFERRRRYNPVTAYSASKLANLLFTFELDRRARAAGRELIAVAAHPGLTDTELVPNTTRMHVPGPFAELARWGNKLISQGVATGALPQLYAATAADVRSGEYLGPTSLGETRGAPGRVPASPAACQQHTARLLWDRTAQLTGVTPDPA